MTDDRLFEQIPEIMSRLDPDLTVRAQNRRSREAFDAGEGRPCHQVHFGRDERCPGCGIEDVLSGKRSGSWFLTDKRSEQPSYYEVTVAPVLDGEGRIESLIEVIRDATVSFAVEQHLIRTSEELESEVESRSEELRELTTRTEELRGQLEHLKRDQAALVQTEKMASVGRLAAGLTHEIHTPLGALLSNGDMLKRCLDRITAELDGSEAPPSANAVAELRHQLDNCERLLDLQRTAGERLRKIILSLRMFAHLDRADMEDYDLHEGIDAALALLTHETKGRIEVQRDYGELPPVRCRPDAINQVFMNLLENAVQAIDAEGRIRVSTRLERNDQDEVVLEFHDNGRGIQPENLSRILEPGFTTKPRGVGTGLGLAIAQRTVADHGGRIDVRSEPGRQTVFTLHLPVRMEAR